MAYKKIGFYGLGLIGGSLAKALKSYDREIEIIATARHEETIQKAYWDGLISNSTLLSPNDFRDCDLIFLCAPVKDNIEYLSSLKPVISEKTVISDVGSVKQPIVDEAEKLSMKDKFIGAHPMTGKEVGGYDVSDPEILNGAPYIIVSKYAQAALRILQELLQVDLLYGRELFLKIRTRSFIF